MQAKKKAAKKTYKPSVKKKTVPSLKRMTLEEYIAFRAEADAKMDARQAKTEAAIDRLSAENRKSREETEIAFKELSAEFWKTYVLVRDLSRNMGGLNNSFGLLVEVVVIPKIRADINAVGKHTFNRVLVDKKISAIAAGEKKTIGEIDMFLFSDADAEAMVVEIKAQLSMNQVKERLERLQKFREYEEEAEIKGKKLFGAVAAIYIDPSVKAFALENGLYVVEIREEEDRLDIEKPEICRTW